MNISTYERFKAKTNVDIRTFFVNFVDFFNNDYQNIIDYYVNGSELDSVTVKNLKALNDFSQQIKSIYNNTEGLTSYFDDFELLDNFEQACVKIDTVLNSKKWFRANKGLSFDNKVEKDFILKQGQNLINLAEEVGYTDPNNDWVNLALRNDLKEEDYSEEGGVKLKITFENNADYKLKGVLDSISGINIYGKDIYRKISYEDNDIVVLGYESTRDQTFLILLSTIKGGVPEFPNDGISKGLTGSNINALQYPILIRQIADLFAKDDLFKSVGLTNIFREKDMIFATITAQTRIGDVLGENLKLS